jgi:hypothetical protein
MKTDMSMRNYYLLTLREAIDEFQGRKRLELEDRDARNSFNAARYLSAKLGYCDETTVWKFINQSTSKVKFGVGELAAMCIEIGSAAAIEDLLSEVKEEINKKKALKKEKLQNQLSLL